MRWGAGWAGRWVDKDDVKDVLDGRAPEAGGLAYEVMVAVARRQLEQGLSVICDSPLVSRWAFDQARRAARDAGAELVVVESRCGHRAVWRARIEARRGLALAAHHQTSWAGLQTYLEWVEAQARYRIAAPHLVVDTGQRSLDEVVAEVIAWLGRWPRGRLPA
jgi:predicted kinase